MRLNLYKPTQAAVEDCRLLYGGTTPEESFHHWVDRQRKRRPTNRNNVNYEPDDARYELDHDEWTVVNSEYVRGKRVAPNVLPFVDGLPFGNGGVTNRTAQRYASGGRRELRLRVRVHWVLSVRPYHSHVNDYLVLSVDPYGVDAQHRLLLSVKSCTRGTCRHNIYVSRPADGRLIPVREREHRRLAGDARQELLAGLAEAGDWRGMGAQWSDHQKWLATTGLYPA